MISKYLTQKNIIFFIMSILVIAFIASIADIALMFFASFVISCTLIPFIDKMEKYIPRAAAVSIALLVLIIGIALVFIPLTIFTLEQGHAIFQKLPSYISQIEALLNFKIMGFSLSEVLKPEALSKYANAMSTELLDVTINLTKSFANSATAAIAITIMVFYICYDTKHLKDGFMKLFPPRFKKKAQEILTSITQKVGGYVFAQLIAMIFVGAVTALGLALIGNKHAIALGFVTFALDIIPVIGPTVAILIGAVSGAAHGFWYIILTFGIYMIAQVLQNQVLRPMVFGKLMDMHPLIIILSLLIGAKFLGVWGVILAPAIASVVCVLVDELYLKTVNEGQ